MYIWRNTILLTLQQHGFELCGSTSMWIFIEKDIWKNFGDFWQFENLIDESGSLEILKTLFIKLHHEV